MPAIQNQQTGLTYLVMIDNQEITEHNRKITIVTNQTGSDVELGRGITKRYTKRNKKQFNISFTYLPNSTLKTVDGRSGRDYLVSIVNIKNSLTLKIKLDPRESFKTYECYINSYSETLVKRDISTQCSYYDISIDLEER